MVNFLHDLPFNFESLLADQFLHFANLDLIQFASSFNNQSKITHQSIKISLQVSTVCRKTSGKRACSSFFETTTTARDVRRLLLDKFNHSNESEKNLLELKIVVVVVQRSCTAGRPDGHQRVGFADSCPAAWLADRVVVRVVAGRTSVAHFRS